MFARRFTVNSLFTCQAGLSYELSVSLLYDTSSNCSQLQFASNERLDRMKLCYFAYQATIYSLMLIRSISFEIRVLADNSSRWFVFLLRSSVRNCDNEEHQAELSMEILFSLGNLKFRKFVLSWARFKKSSPREVNVHFTYEFHFSGFDFVRSDCRQLTIVHWRLYTLKPYL